MSSVKVSLIQMSMSKNIQKNVDKAAAMVVKAAKQGGQIICLPELFHTLYFPIKEHKEPFSSAVSISSPVVEVFLPIARKYQSVIVVPIFEKRTKGLYHNSLAVIDDTGSIQGIYRKMHIPDDPCFYEKYYFAPGDLGFKVFQTRYGNIGTLICWDQWYPEAARICALKGADILFYPTAIGWMDQEVPAAKPKQLDAWRTVQRSHAITNGIHVAAANRCGKEGNLTFWGNSFIAGPDGALLTKPGKTTECILHADCDFQKTEQQRQEWPFLRDRRIDGYKDITKRFADI